MNIQIFGTKKSADTRKAQRYFQERRIKFQFVDLSQKGMSKGEFESVARVVGGQDAMIDLTDHDRFSAIDRICSSLNFFERTSSL